MVLARLRPFDERVLACLVNGGGRVMTREEIAAAIWPDAGRGAKADLRSIDVAITRIRKALGPQAAAVVTVRRVGYRYDPEKAS